MRTTQLSSTSPDPLSIADVLCSLSVTCLIVPANPLKAALLSCGLHMHAGIGALFCRHAVLYVALNLFTGERWAYATYLMFIMMEQHGICPAFFWCAHTLVMLVCVSEPESAHEKYVYNHILDKAMELTRLLAAHRILVNVSSP